jgi:hypothetical protein
MNGKQDPTAAAAAIQKDAETRIAQLKQ